MINPTKKNKKPIKPNIWSGLLEYFVTKKTLKKSKKPLNILDPPYFDSPNSRDLWLTGISVIVKPFDTAKYGINLCNPPYIFNVLITFALYAFNPQLKSWILTPIKNLVTRLNIFDGKKYVKLAVANNKRYKKNRPFPHKPPQNCVYEEVGLVLVPFATKLFGKRFWSSY